MLTICVHTIHIAYIDFWQENLPENKLVLFVLGEKVGVPVQHSLTKEYKLLNALTEIKQQKMKGTM